MADTKTIDSKFLISLGIGLAIQAAGIVWWASSLGATKKGRETNGGYLHSTEWWLHALILGGVPDAPPQPSQSCCSRGRF